jgi:putative peptide zinc metalloprotease protein
MCAAAGASSSLGKAWLEKVLRVLGLVGLLVRPCARRTRPPSATGASTLPPASLCLAEVAAPVRRRRPRNPWPMSPLALEPSDMNPDRPGSPTPCRLVAGTELFGEYEASAFTAPRYLLRRADGQVIALTQLLYLVASCLDGRRSAGDVATQVSGRFGRPVSADNVTYLIDTKLAPLGVLAADGVDTALTRPDPLLLGLRLRTRMVPERLHRAVTRALRPLFWPPLVVAHPEQLLVIIAISVAVGFFHETGHATAARYGGATPGVMGVGIYLMLPVFYTDVTDSYRLPRRGGLRTDLGGLYFNVIAILTAAGIYSATHLGLLLVFIGLSQLEMIYQFLPFVRMDGYYVVSDLIGVPNLFAYVAPVIGRAVHRSDSAGQARLARLRPAARWALTAWVALTVPILALNAALLGFLAPRIFPTMWTSAHTQSRDLARSVAAGNVIGGLNHLTGLVLVAVPAAGLLFAVSLLLRRTASAARRLAIRRLHRIAEHLAALRPPPGHRRPHPGRRRSHRCPCRLLH